MKKIVPLTLALALSLVGCAQQEVKEETTGNVNTQEESDTTQSDEPVMLHFHENWDFEGGMSPLPVEGYATGTYGNRFFLPNMYETLVEYKNGEYVGNLAKSWEVSEDGKTYTFYLKEGVKFSDGEPFNAEAVKLNLEATPITLGEFINGYGKTPTNIASVEVMDELTVKVNLNEAYYGTLHDFTFLVSMSMLSPNAYTEDLKYSEANLTGSYGTGPYMYEGDFDGTTYTFVRNPYYHNEAPDADGFTVTVVPDDASAVLALRSGELSMISGNTNLTSDTLNEFQNNEDYGISIAEGYTHTTSLVLNPTQYPFDDVVVRNAVAQAIDRETITETLFGAYGSPSYRFMYEAYPYSSKADPSKSMNVEAANTLLEENGYVDTDGDGIREKDGKDLSFELSYISTDATGSDFSLLLQSQLQEIGVEATIAPYDSNTWYNGVKGSTFGMTWFNTAGANDPYMTMGNLYSGSADQRAKHAGIGSEGLDELVLEMITKVDDAEIEALYTQILNNVAENDILIPVYTPRDMTLFSTEFISSIDTAGTFSDYDVEKIKLK